jgi:hypothetical protein
MVGDSNSVQAPYRVDERALQPAPQPHAGGPHCRPEREHAHDALGDGAAAQPHLRGTQKVRVQLLLASRDVHAHRVCRVLCMRPDLARVGVLQRRRRAR